MAFLHPGRRPDGSGWAGGASGGDASRVLADLPQVGRPLRIATCWDRLESVEHVAPGACANSPATEGQASCVPSTPSSSIRATMRWRVAGSSKATTSQTRLRSTPR
jgi:hypothetical protein